MRYFHNPRIMPKLLNGNKIKNSEGDNDEEQKMVMKLKHQNNSLLNIEYLKKCTNESPYSMNKIAFNPVQVRMRNQKRAGVFSLNNDLMEDNSIQIPTLRSAMKKSPKKVEIMERFWNNRIYNISEKNRDNYKAFRIYFK